MVTVRDAGPEDLGAVIQLVRRLGGDAALSEGLVRRFLAFPDTEILVAEGEGRVLGVLCSSYRPDLYHAGDNCFIEELCVAEQARGRGVGRELMEEVLRRARARGCVHVSVAALNGNRRAIEFYRRHGFEEAAVLLGRRL